MPTTALLVEIVIVGLLFYLSALPFIDLLFQPGPESVMEFYTNVPLQYQLVAAYAAGVIWNRICDQVFKRVDNKLILSKFSSKEDYQAARIMVVLHSESLRDYIGNFRSLIRISRATSVLFGIYAVAMPIYAFVSDIANELTSRNKLALIIINLVFLLASTYAWFRLERGYVSAVYHAHKGLEQMNELKAKSIS